MKRRSILIYLVLLIVGANVPAMAEKGERLKIGDTFPKFFTKRIDGSNFFLNDYVGERAKEDIRALLFSFCSSTCKPCKREIPELEKIKEKYAEQGLEVILIDTGEDKLLAQQLIDELGTKLPVLVDRYAVVIELVGNPPLPHSVLLDGAGDVRYLHTGFPENNPEDVIKELEDAIVAVLGSAPGDADQ